MAANPPSQFWWVGCQNHAGRPAMVQQRVMELATDTTYHDNTCIIQIFLVPVAVANIVEYEIVPPVAASLKVKGT